MYFHRRIFSSCLSQSKFLCNSLPSTLNNYRPSNTFLNGTLWCSGTEFHILHSSLENRTWLRSMFKTEWKFRCPPIRDQNKNVVKAKLGLTSLSSHTGLGQHMWGTQNQPHTESPLGMFPTSQANPTLPRSHPAFIEVLHLCTSQKVALAHWINQENRKLSCRKAKRILRILIPLPPGS